MRLIHWNCQCAFRKKNERILSYDPDILMVAECESTEKLKLGKLTPEPHSHLWFGDNLNKGIGIFSYSANFKLEVMDCYNPEYRYIIPVKVSGRDQDFTLLAVWAMGNTKYPSKSYIGQVWLALEYYEDLLTGPAILVGDFNSNKIWDHFPRAGNHSAVVKKLQGHDIHSIYHLFHNQEQGEEEHPTFYMYRKQEKPYHIDYCFLSGQLITENTSLEVGSYEEWCDVSDHVPLMVDI